jgi:hypothetical protein
MLCCERDKQKKDDKVPLLERRRKKRAIAKGLHHLRCGWNRDISTDIQTLLHFGSSDALTFFSSGSWQLSEIVTAGVRRIFCTSCMIDLRFLGQKIIRHGKISPISPATPKFFKVGKKVSIFDSRRIENAQFRRLADRKSSSVKLSYPDLCFRARKAKHWTA